MAYINSKGIIGAIAGDIIGSRFERHNRKSTNFELFSPYCRFTDDTVMTVAVADWLISGRDLNETMYRWGRKYPHAGYGGGFRKWLSCPNPENRRPYNSFGNGSGMRVSPCGFYARTMDEALQLAKESAEVTHNHPEGIKGAQAIASAIVLAREGFSRNEIKSFVEERFGYDLGRSCEEIRPVYRFDVSCQGSCPQAIIAFLDSEDYESAVRLAVSLGGDSDTIACMSGSIAAAFYGVPPFIIEKTLGYLSPEIMGVVEAFDRKVGE